LSSILKALKKIEENSPSPELHPSLPNPLDTNQLLDSNIKNRRRRRRLLYLFLILVLLAGTTALLFNHRQLLIAKVWSIMSSESPEAEEASNPVSVNVYKAKVPTSSVKPVTKPPTATRQPRKPIKNRCPEALIENFRPIQNQPMGGESANRYHPKNPPAAGQHKR
jgi:hypothetical protein